MPQNKPSECLRKRGKSNQLNPPSTSLLSTGGGLIFPNDVGSSLKTLDAATGDLHWESSLDDRPSSNLITYSVEGLQYIAVVVGIKQISPFARRPQTTPIALLRIG